jgi:hypothetical protein
MGRVAICYRYSYEMVLLFVVLPFSICIPFSIFAAAAGGRRFVPTGTTQISLHQLWRAVILNFKEQHFHHLYLLEESSLD